MATNSIKENLVGWRASLMPSIPLSGLISRDPVTYKWKSPFRCWLLREATFWRVTDLLSQSLALHEQGHGLGARILLRSSFETLATLIYLNLLIREVVSGQLNFHLFGRKTETLLFGSRDQSTKHKSLNIITVLGKCNKRYPGLLSIYESLSESAHPNYEGMLAGYSAVDRKEFETRFLNRWMDTYGASHTSAMELCMRTYHYEYDNVWVGLIEELEIWVNENNNELEVTRLTES